jgi:hypothetical protein
MPISRAAAWEFESERGHDVWRLMCRSALRAVELAARAFGLESTENRVERAELFVSYGVAPPTLANVPRSRGSERAVDWAKLGDFERARLAREMKGTARQ